MFGLIGFFFRGMFTLAFLAVFGSIAAAYASDAVAIAQNLEVGDVAVYLEQNGPDIAETCGRFVQASIEVSVELIKELDAARQV